jgi:hypothetical protein
VTDGAGQRGIGSVYGTSRERPFDRWFRFPAGFSEEALDLASGAIGPRSKSIVDPFCGSAAAATGLAGRNVVGIETHPLIADLAATKLARPPGDAAGLCRAARLAVELAAEAGDGDLESEHPLVRRCFDRATLQHLVALRNAVVSPKRSPWRRYLRWALLGTLRDVASVKVGWPYQRPGVGREAPYGDAARRFLTRVEMIGEDLGKDTTRPRGRIVRGDSRGAGAWTRAAAGQLFDACVTSPPYLNNFDYADATRLELYFLKTVSSWAEMCVHVRSGMLVATTQQSARVKADRALVELRQYESIASEIKQLTAQLASERACRKRGKEYDQVLPAYFLDIARVLTHLHTHTRKGGRAVWVVGDSAPYGVYIDTPRIIGALAEDLGFTLIDDITVRSRGLRWRTNGSRHQVPLSERLITLRRR